MPLDPCEGIVDKCPDQAVYPDNATTHSETITSEYEQTKLTPEGYINMVQEYVNNFPSKYDHLGDLTIDNINNIRNNFEPLELKSLIHESKKWTP